MSACSNEQKEANMKLSSDYNISDTLQADAEIWHRIAAAAAHNTVVETIHVSEPFGRTHRIVAKRVIRTKRANEIRHDREIAAWHDAVNKAHDEIDRIAAQIEQYEDYMSHAATDFDYEHAAELHDDAQIDLAAAKAFHRSLVNAKPTITR